MNLLFTKKEILPGIKLEELLKLSEKDLELTLASLKFHELYDLVLSVPWNERAKIILYSPFAEGIVKNLPPQELFLTLKASSLDLATELLSYAKASQIQFMFDLDAWYKDRIKSERVASWIVLLFQAGEDKVLEWLKIVDWDFLIAIFQRFIKVYKKPDEMELIEAMDFLPSYTLDDFYFIEFKVPSLDFYFRRMLEMMRSEMPDTYFALMESVIWEIPAEIEERAYRWRNGRLADEGIPEYFEALDIYSYIHPKNLKKIEPKYLPIETTIQPSINIAVYTGPEELFIFKVFEMIKDLYQIERIKKELAWVANKVIIVDNVVIDDIEQIRKSLDKVWGALNIGLEYLSLGNLEIAKKFLEEHFLEDIFKVSQTALRELRKFALQLTKNEEIEPSILNYLDQPYQGFLQGVLVKKLNEMKLFQPDKVGTSEEYTHFKRLSEIHMVRRYIEEIGYMGPLIKKLFGPSIFWINEVTQPKRNFGVNFLTWSSLILTALANWIYKKEFIFKALPKSCWRKVIREILEQKENVCKIKEEVKNFLFENFNKFAKTEWYLEPELLKSFLDFVIKRLEDEFKYIDLNNPPDPKYQTLILIDLEN